MSNCSKCGIRTDLEHKEETCDFPGIDWDNIEELIAVDDIDFTDLKIKSGYGTYELSMIYDIMRELWSNPPEGVQINIVSNIMMSNLDLFYEAEKIFKEKWQLQ